MSAAPISNVKREAVHVRTDEKMIATVSRDGGLQGAEVRSPLCVRCSCNNLYFLNFIFLKLWSFQVLGVVSLSVSSPEFNTVAVQMHNKAPSGAQLQVGWHLLM